MKTEVIGDPKAFHLQFAAYPLSKGSRTMAMYFDGPKMLDYAWGASVRDCMDVMAARREPAVTISPYVPAPRHDWVSQFGNQRCDVCFGTREECILASYSTPGLRKNMLADTVVLPSTVEREGADGQTGEAHRVQGS